MRTRCDYNATDPNPCGERTRAETEDYTLTVVDPPSCPDPSALTATNETTSGADLGWTENGSSTHWDLEIGTTGFTPTGTPTDNDVTTNPYTWSGGNAATSYDFYVRADCGADNSDVSGWVGPYTFTTLCNSESVPWTEGFEGMASVGDGIVPICMAEDGDWTTADANQSNNREPHTGTNYVYTKWTADDYLFTPGIDLTGGTSYDFSFWYITDGNSGWTTVEAKYGTGQTSGDMTTTIGTPISDPTNTSYLEFKGSFTPASSGTYYLAIHVVANSSPWYITFDDLKVEETPSCLAPTGLSVDDITTTTADLHWDAVAGASGFNWEIVPAGNGQGNGVVTSGTTTGDGSADPDVDDAGGLSPSTSYDLYVQTDCGGGSTSSWSGPVTFTTLTPPPANDDCANATALTVGTSCSMATYTNAGATDSGESPSPGCGNYNGADVWFSFVVPALGHVIIDSDVGDITDGAMAAYSGTCGALSLIECDDDDSANGSMPMLDLTGLTAGETVYIRFWEYGGNVFGTFDICVYEGPCTTPTGLSATNETTSGADLSWTENGGADHWDLYIVTAGSPAPDASTTPTVDDTPDNPYTWTGGTASTDYDWYVRADCGASGGSGQSDWSVKGTFTTASADAVDWCNLQWPDQATITAGGSVDVYAQVYEPGVTDATGQGAGITAWIGYSTTDTDPSTWTDWVAATYNVDSGNNDEYQAALGAGLAPGTYYYASRFKLNSGAYQYGGYSSGGGGFWDGTNYVSGVLTVNHIDGDLCTNAIALTVNDICTNTTGSNVGATASGEAPAPSCSDFGSGEDVWYSFVVPSTGNVTVEMSDAGGPTDWAMSIYSGSCGSLAEVECDDDDGPGLFPSISLTGQTPGATLYVRVFEYGNNETGDFNICAKKDCPSGLVVLPASSSSTTSTGSCVDGEWTHYYNGTNILLSLKLGSSGAVITDVTVDPDGATDAFWGDNDTDGFPEVSGAPGAAFMRRKWDVNASTQPSSDVGIRFYYTTDEYDAVNTEISSHGGTPLSSTSELNFYKVLSSSTEQDPFNVEPGGLGIGDIKLIEHGTNPGITEWVDGTFGTENYAEYLVSGFSGGGGGGASNGAVLPIELISFSGYAGKDANILQWTTLSEINMAMFYVERSVSGEKWTLIDKEEAAGDSYIQQDYKFVDKEPLTKAFYRLRMMDKNGRYSMSKVISIERKDSGLKLNAVYPNPNDGNFVVNLTSMPNEDGKIILVNTLGVKVFTKELSAQGGNIIEKINVSHLPTGVYTLLLEQNDKIITKRVMINR